MNISDTINAGKYISGHPDLDRELPIALLFDAGDRIEICGPSGFKLKALAAIPKTAIKGLTVEDNSTFEKRVTVGRVLLLGVFALAAQKNKKKEAAYLILEWSRGHINNTTVFEFTGMHSVQRANIVRNTLLKTLPSEPVSNGELETTVGQTSAEQIKALFELKQMGAITDSEYEMEKKKVLSSTTMQ